MNLGDGLLFELENGKPKLIILSRDVQKNPVKSSLRSRAGSVLGSRQLSCLEEVQVEGHVRQQGGGCRSGKQNSGGPSINIPENKLSKNVTSKKHDQPSASAHVPKVRSNRHKPLGSTKVKPGLTQEKAGTDNVVCLTNDQLQQILNAVQTASTLVTGPTQESDVIEENHREDLTLDDKGGEEVVEPREDLGKETSVDKDSRTSGGLLHWLHERESSSQAAIHAKRAQWKKELSEQVALKQHRSAAGRLQTVNGSESFTHKEPPTAVRSVLQIGEVSSMYERQNEERREEQRRLWLEELDRQREETSERRRREKLLQSQTEDHDHWAAHFDSLQRRLPVVSVAPPSVSSRGWEPTSSLSLWDAASSCGVDSVVGASVDLTSRLPARTSYLRSMTALLDPVQMEERERKRLKQLEQQRAIEAQVEERRLQKQKEAELKRAEEEEEEKRLALERAALQRQYEKERETQKEQQKTNEVLGVLQPELRRGQSQCDVTDTEPHTENTPAECQEMKTSRPVSSYKDTAVQTDSDLLPSTDVKPQAPEASSQTHHPPRHPLSSRLRNVKSGKENICTTGGGVDPYEPFARSERSKKDKKRPEWNTQRPSRHFVPASERYPATLQKVRQESRLKRQAELIALQERARLTQEPRLSSNPPLSRASKSDSKGQIFSATVNIERGRTPTLPSLRSGAQIQQASSARPQLPVLEYVPCVRPDEGFHQEPVVPVNAANTATVGTEESNEALNAPAPAQPETLYNSYVQQKQEILRGLAQLRQGLLQKQRELESDLSPPRHHHDDSKQVTSGFHG